MSLTVYFTEINNMVDEGNTYEQISAHLKLRYGVTRGASPANIRNFCRSYGINSRRNSLTNQQVNAVINAAVRQVGPAYGRRMMTGYLRSRGYTVAEKRVAHALRQNDLPHHIERLQGVRNMNPIPYHAGYFGHKLHMDQNEKLAMFGVTHVIAIDGYSSYIVGYSTMSRKNNLTIYADVYRPAIIEHGIWDTLRVDHGTEFYLTIFMQLRNAAKRFNCDRSPYVQSQSKQNLRVERIWPEVNNRINYPLKAALVEMVDNELLNLDDPVHQFCTSNLTIQVARIGMSRFVEAWNSHHITGRGIPIQLKQHRSLGTVSPADVPTAETAATLYQEEYRTELTQPYPYGRYPFPNEDQRGRCDSEFRELVPNLGVLLDETINKNSKPFQNALQTLIQITRRFSQQE